MAVLLRPRDRRAERSATSGRTSWRRSTSSAEGDGAGASFGWSAFEGDAAFNDDQSSPDAIGPVLVASHEDGNCSITGGLVVRDRDLESLYGRYLWGDFCVGELRSFTAEPGTSRRATTGRSASMCPSSRASATDNAGNVYAVSLDGPVYRLDPSA